MTSANSSFDIVPNNCSQETACQMTSATQDADQLPDYGHIIFKSLVVLIGFVGMIANGFVLYVLCISKQLTKQIINVLFLNQALLDLFCCVWLVIVYSINMSTVDLSGTAGWWLCSVICNESLIYVGIDGSSMNLACIAIERYVMIVHPIWHKTQVRHWMIYAMIGFVWTGSVTSVFAASWTTTRVVDGLCIVLSWFPNPAAQIAYGVWYFVMFFAAILASFIFCYGQILVTVRRQAKVFAVKHANNPLAVTAKDKNMRIQMNAVKTMIAISVLFVVCWLPFNVYNLILTVYANMTFMTSTYYFFVVLAFFNICLNPFIYATKYDLIRRFWIRLIPCCKEEVNKSSDGRSTTANVATAQSNL